LLGGISFVLQRIGDYDPIFGESAIVRLVGGGGVADAGPGARVSAPEVGPRRENGRKDDGRSVGCFNPLVPLWPHVVINTDR